MSGLNSWIKNNVATILTVGGLLIALIGQWNYFSLAAQQTWKNDTAIQQHISDTTRHIDPNRDELRMREILNRLDKIERKLDDIIRESR